MNNLQPLFLNIATARQHSQDIMNKINRLAGSTNVEDQKKAVGLGVELTRSLINERHAIDAYMGALGRSLLSNLDQSKTMSRAAYNALTPRKRLEFAQSGGRVVN